MIKFDNIEIDPLIIQSLNEMGFEEPTPIQREAVPLLLAGKDVLGQAQTGTGKTAAFGIPLVQLVNARSNNVQALILTPTRELAIQVAGEIRKIGKKKNVKVLPVYGGQLIGHQIRALKKDAQIVVGTPGRILDHLARQTLNLHNIKTLILDEADEMLDMGFIDDIEKIIKQAPKDIQTLLFSATMPYEIKRISKKYMKSPVNISIAKGEVTVPAIEQVYYKILEKDKLEGFCRVLDQEQIDLAIVFCRTKKGVDELVDSLQDRGYMAEGLHGDLTQSQRDSVMAKFRDTSIEILVATDVAARGIDVENVSHVINFDIPQDPESYVHRIGRTGRAGRKGIAITLVTPREIKQLITIQSQTKSSIIAKKVPSLEEAVGRHKKNWIDKIIDIIENENITDYEQELLEISSKHQQQQLLAAAFKLHMEQYQSKSEGKQYEFGNTGADKGKVRFFVSVGKNGEFTPRIILDIFQEQAGIDANSIGRISIFDRFSFVEISEEQAPFVYEAFQNARINGKRINIEPAKPRV